MGYYPINMNDTTRSQLSVILRFYTKQDFLVDSFSRPTLSTVEYFSGYFLSISHSTICFWIDRVRVYKYTKIKGLDSR